MANPATCLHRIIAPGITGNAEEGFKSVVYCVSCDTDLTGSELIKDKLYEYDIDQNVWVYVPARRVERTQTRTNS